MTNKTKVGTTVKIYKLRYWILFGYAQKCIIKSVLMNPIKFLPPHEFG